jgi:hypothetical protein
MAARGARSWVAAAATALILLVLLAVPMSAATTRTKLSNAAVSPRSGTTATTIAVSVVYQNANGSRADIVSVTFGSKTYLMARDAGGSWGKGVVFRWSGKLAAGHHGVVITAKAKNDGDASLAAGSVNIAKPPDPTPAPTPRPTPKPKPTPTPTPRATTPPTAPPATTPPPTAGSGTTFPLATPEPTPVPVPSTGSEPDVPSVGPTSGPPDVPVTAVVVGASGGGSHGSGPGPGPAGPGVSDSSIDPNGGPSEPRPRGGWGPLAGVLALAGLQGSPAFPAFGLAPTLVTTTTAVGAAMALSLFGRRRREDDPPDELLAASAANGVAVAAYDVIGQAGVESDEEVDLELLLPRWRRPSLLQARKADPIRDQVQAPRLTFDEGLVGPLAGRERRIIRYRVVRLLDTPDELRGVEIGYLDQGDEVQLLEKYGAYWLVVAPDGQQGWLHKMTLGDIHEADSGSGERPTASMPIAADSWTMAESDIDSDVLEAYLESRRRSA